MDASTAGDERVRGQGDELDATTLDAFVREHRRRLTSLARLVCLDATEAGDAVQVALEQAWRRRSSACSYTSGPGRPTGAGCSTSTT